MELKHIPLDRLKLAAVNMRHARKAPDVSDILPTIRSHGILQPLLVRENCDGRFEVVAGRRRYFAARTIAAETGSFDDLPCAVMRAGDDTQALEASLVENSARLDPDPMTRWETFSRLVKQGKSVDEIAQTFGVTDLMVERSLALGNLIPKIRRAYRDEEIDAETIRHLTMASKARQKDWLALHEDPEQWAPTGYQLKRWLFGGAQIATGAALFSLEDYPGEIVTDLFGERSYFADANLFWEHQNAAVAAERDSLAAKDWEVEILEIGKHFHSWNYAPVSKKDGGRVYITVSNAGEVEVHKGYLTVKEVRRREQAAAAQAGEAPSEATAARPELTQAMQNYLELHRHAAVRVRLLGEPATALRLALAHAIAGSGLWTVEPDATRPHNPTIAESLAASPAREALEHERAAVLALLGQPKSRETVVSRYADGIETARVFAALLKLSDAEVLRVLAYVMAETLQAGSPAVEALGNRLAMDMAEFWQPDETFFELLRDKKAINAILRQVAGKTVADAHVTATAKVQKQLIRDCLAGENGRAKAEDWLPGYMTFPFKAYTKAPGIAIAEAWSKIKRHFKTK